MPISFFFELCKPFVELIWFFLDKVDLDLFRFPFDFLGEIFAITNPLLLEDLSTKVVRSRFHLTF